MEKIGISGLQEYQEEMDYAIGGMRKNSSTNGYCFQDRLALFPE